MKTIALFKLSGFTLNNFTRAGTEQSQWCHILVLLPVKGDSKQLLSFSWMQAFIFYVLIFPLVFLTLNLVLPVFDFFEK